MSALAPKFLQIVADAIHVPSSLVIPYFAGLLVGGGTCTSATLPLALAAGLAPRRRYSGISVCLKPSSFDDG